MQGHQAPASDGYKSRFDGAPSGFRGSGPSGDRDQPPGSFGMRPEFSAGPRPDYGSGRNDYGAPSGDFRGSFRDGSRGRGRGDFRGGRGDRGFRGRGDFRGRGSFRGGRDSDGSFRGGRDSDGGSRGFRGSFRGGDRGFRGRGEFRGSRGDFRGGRGDYRGGPRGHGDMMAFGGGRPGFASRFDRDRRDFDRRSRSNSRSDSRSRSRSRSRSPPMRRRPNEDMDRPMRGPPPRRDDPRSFGQAPPSRGSYGGMFGDGAMSGAPDYGKLMQAYQQQGYPPAQPDFAGYAAAAAYSSAPKPAYGAAGAAGAGAGFGSAGAKRPFDRDDYRGPHSDAKRPRT